MSYGRVGVIYALIFGIDFNCKGRVCAYFWDRFSVVPTYTVQGSSSVITETTRTTSYNTASIIRTGQTILTGATMCLNTTVLKNGTTINVAATIYISVVQITAT
jgi:hypothetical protein